MIGRSSEGAGGWSLSTTAPWNPSKDPQQFSTMIEEEEEEKEEEISEEKGSEVDKPIATEVYFLHTIVFVYIF